MSAILTLLAGILFGFLAQRSRFCTVSPIRNLILTRDWRVLKGIVALVVTTYTLYSITGYFGWIERSVPRFGQHLLGMSIVVFASALGLGLVSMLMGSCPAREHVLAAQGNNDALFYLLGFYIGIIAYLGFISDLIGAIL